MKNTFGSDLSLTIFGESHGRAVGAVLDGMAAGVPVADSEKVTQDLSVIASQCRFSPTGKAGERSEPERHAV